MKASENLVLKNKILKLAKTHATGTPAQMASLIGVSERSLSRIISDIRDEGVNISYSRTLRTYILD